jgi:hypothetical protein
LKQTGQSYTSVRGKLVAAKFVNAAACGATCKKKCSSKISKANQDNSCLFMH